MLMRKKIFLALAISAAALSLFFTPTFNRAASSPAMPLTGGVSSEQQKSTLLSCVGCHTVERIVRSKYDAAGFTQAILPRMASYANQSTPLRPQLRLGARDTALVGEDQARLQRMQAEWLSTINLSASSTWNFPLKTLPRPRGKATQVIITEYDLPPPTLEPHDVVVDAA